MPFAVATALPFAFAIFEIEASEYSAVISIRVPLIRHKIREIRVERARTPKLFRGIFTIGFGEANRARAHVHGRGQKDGVISHHVRLKSAKIRKFPLVR